MVFYEQGQYHQSALGFRKCIEYENQCKPTSFVGVFKQQEIIANTALAYLKFGNTDSCLYFSKLALNFISENETRSFPDKKQNWWTIASSVVYGTIGNAYFIESKLDSAEIFYKKSIELKKVGNDNFSDRCLNLMRLAEINLVRDKLADVKIYIDQDDQMMAKSRAEFISKNDSLELAEIRSEIRWKYYNKIVDSDKGFYFIKQYHENFVKLQNYKIALLINNLASGIDNGNAKANILSLENKVEKGNLRSIVLSLLVLIVLLIAISARFWYLKIKKENTKKDEDYKIILLETQREFDALVRNSDDLMWAVDKEFKLTSFNAAYADCYKLNFDGNLVLGDKEKLLRKFKKETKATSLYQNVLDMGNDIVIYTHGMNGSINVSEEMFRFRPINCEKGLPKGVACLCQDITEFLSVKKNLAMKNESLSKIAWQQSHEIRGPVTTIKGLLNIINDHELTEEDKAEMMIFLGRKIDELDQSIIKIVKFSEESEKS